MSRPGTQSPDLVGRHQFRVGAEMAHGIAAPRIFVELGGRVREVEHAALREHDIVVQLVGQVLPHLHRMLVEADVLRQQIVRADGRGVAADIARTEIALLQHGDIGNAVFLGEIVGRGQAVPAAADDDDIVGWLRIGLAPCRLPVPVSGKRIPQDRESRIFRHRCMCSRFGDAPDYRPGSRTKASFAPRLFTQPTSPCPRHDVTFITRRQCECRSAKRVLAPIYAKAVSIRSLIVGLLLIAAALLMPSGVPWRRRSADAGAGRSPTQQQASSRSLRSRTDELEKKIHANADDDFRLGDIRLQLEEIARAADQQPACRFARA